MQKPTDPILMPDCPHIFALDPEALGEHISQLGMPRYRARQVLRWVYKRHIADPAAMTDLPKADREVLGQSLLFQAGRVVGHQRATDGVQKLLLDWTLPMPIGTDAVNGVPSEQATSPAEGGTTLTVLTRKGAAPGGGANQTECVIIPSERTDPPNGKPRGGQSGRREAVADSRGKVSGHSGVGGRRTACISSQVGCPVGCGFCASGLGGLDGNLTAGQIVEQVWQLGALEGVGRISHVVFMGMGEPLANFDAVTEAIDILRADWGPGISGRRITVSTVGLPQQMRRLADLQLPVTLALSLHAPNDELRRELIPWAAYADIDALLEAGRYYFDRTGREITLEYILLRDVNDRREHAHQLARIASTLRANINLIRYNEVRDLPYSRPATEDVHRFQQTLQAAGINTHIRASRGRDIAAACGQLRHEHAGANSGQGTDYASAGVQANGQR